MKVKTTCRYVYMVVEIAIVAFFIDNFTYPALGRGETITREKANTEGQATNSRPGRTGPTDRVSVLVHLKSNADLGRIHEAAKEQGGIFKYQYKQVMPNVMNLRNLPASAISELESLPGVSRVVEDKYHENVIQLDESTPLIRGLQEQLNASDLDVDGSGVRICICDTGIDMDHIMYADRIDTAASYDFFNNDSNPDDDNGHGSHVAGIAVGGMGLEVDFGCDGTEPFQGIAPKATLIGVKVLDQYGGGYESDIIAGIDHCADPNLPGGPAHVINLSIGIGQYQDACDDHSWAKAANDAVDAGVIVVAAAGNHGSPNALSSPACGSRVMAVGATYKDDYPNCEDASIGFNWCLDADCMYTCTDITPAQDDLVCFSPQSKNMDVVAPGIKIWSASTTQGGASVGTRSGTSMASPHVAGLAALVLAMDPSLTPDQVREIIRDGAIDMGPQGFDVGYGYGRIDVINTLALSCSDDDSDGYYGQRGCGSEKDCNDNNETIFPGAAEIPYDGTDQDCDGSDLTDVDGDDFDAEEVGGPDCNDDDPTIYPGATEVCNEKDDDCDQQVDEDVKIPYYGDVDGDGAGDPNDMIQACATPPGYSSNSDDNCPNDPHKMVPGTCGCGFPDSDSDDDGTLDCIEDGGPAEGDGNGDSIPDSQQPNVTSLKTYDGDVYATLSSPAGTTMNCQSVSNPSPSDSPEDSDFSFGFFRFTVSGVAPGAALSVMLHLHVDASPDTYYKHGSTPENHADHWYEFLYDGKTGAEIKGNVITLHFINGDRGDDDLDAENDLIIDVGGPGVVAVQSQENATSAPSSGGGGGGGGCVIGISQSALWQ